ncbi:MAG: ATP-binding cassette domain-containing protein, partial [Oscillospiraceae bacterium]
MALLEVKGITKVFGGLTAVENVDFEVNSGEIVSIIGPNGAGKTTIFNMLTGIYKVDDGGVYFDGKAIHNTTPQHIVRSGIARTFQNIRLFPNMRVIENVMIGNHINTKYGFFDEVFRTKKFKTGERDS